MSAIIALVFPLLLIAGAVSDLVRYEIPNSLPVVILVGYLGYAFASSASLSLIGANLAVGLAVLLVGAALFRFGLLGGGDIKLIAAATPWIGWSELPWFLLWVALWGGVLAAIVLAVRRLASGSSVSGPLWWRRLCSIDNGIPYGVAICAGGLFTFWRSGAFDQVG